MSDYIGRTAQSVRHVRACLPALLLLCLVACQQPAAPWFVEQRLTRERSPEEKQELMQIVAHLHKGAMQRHVQKEQDQLMCLQGRSLAEATPVRCPSAEEQWQMIDTALQAQGLPIDVYGETRRLLLPVLKRDVAAKADYDVASDAIVRLLPVLQGFPMLYVEVIGHANSREVALSRSWARHIAQTLMDAGIEPARLFVRDAADSEPLATEDAVAGRALNRRVELRLNLAR